MFNDALALLYTFLVSRYLMQFSGHKRDNILQGTRDNFHHSMSINAFPALRGSDGETYRWTYRDSHVCCTRHRSLWGYCTARKDRWVWCESMEWVREWVVVVGVALGSAGK